MSPDRRSAIVRLLATRDDHLPSPAARPLSSLGFVHRSTSRESCPDCLANGRRMPGCETCGGRGYLEGRRQRDPYDTGQSLGHFGESAARHEAARERDREIARLEAQTAAPRPDRELVAAVRPEGWEVERERAWAEFDYHALDVALDELRDVDPAACETLHAVDVYGWLHADRLGVAAAARRERGLEFLAGRLPDPLRAPRPPAVNGSRVVSSVKVRDREIRRLVRDGSAVQWVAGEFGLSVSQVNRITSRLEVEA